jgi:hypothetical protein
VHLVTAGELSRLYPVPEYYDPHADELGHVPYMPEFLRRLEPIARNCTRCAATVTK